MKKGETEQLYITDITAHGMGVGRSSDGIAVFVRGALPGDTVLATCYRAKKKYCEADAVRIIDPSPDRVESFCDLNACGGCQYCELSYRKQTEIKRRQIVQDLERIGGIEDPEVDETIAMDEPYFYRNKVTFQVGWRRRVNSSQLEPLVGFYKAGSHDIVDCPVCRIQAPPAEAVASVLRTFMLQEHITCFDSRTKKGLLKDVIVRSCFATGEVMVVFEINGTSIPGVEKLIDMIDEKQPVCWSLESVYIVNDKNVPVLIAGKKTVSEELAGVKFEISPLSFYQVNPLQTVNLYDKVFEYAALSPGDSVLDLYCGVGSIGLYLEDRMDDTVSVLGIESNRSAVLDANRNAVVNCVINARYLCGAAEDVLPDIATSVHEHGMCSCEDGGEHDWRSEHGGGPEDTDRKSGSSGGYGQLDFDDPEEGSNEWFAKNVCMNADVAVLDPPRAGCDERLLRAVCDVSPERIIYVSCDPATLARDVKYLTENGYTFIKATPVDMFPHTGHVESVALMTKYESGGLPKGVFNVL